MAWYLAKHRGNFNFSSRNSRRFITVIRSSPSDHVLNQMHPFHIFTTCLSKLHLLSSFSHCEQIFHSWCRSLLQYIKKCYGTAILNLQFGSVLGHLYHVHILMPCFSTIYCTDLILAGDEQLFVCSGHSPRQLWNPKLHPSPASQKSAASDLHNLLAYYPFYCYLPLRTNFAVMNVRG